MDPISGFGLVASAIKIAEHSATVFKLLFEYFQEVKDAPAKSEAVQQELLAVSLVLKNLATECDKQLLSSDALNHFGALLNEIQSRTSLQDGLTMRRLKWPFTQKENEKYIFELERYKSTFTLALVTSQRYSRNDFFNSLDLRRNSLWSWP